MVSILNIDPYCWEMSFWNVLFISILTHFSLVQFFQLFSMSIQFIIILSSNLSHPQDIKCISHFNVSTIFKYFSERYMLYWFVNIQWEKTVLWADFGVVFLPLRLHEWESFIILDWYQNCNGINDNILYKGCRFLCSS